VVYLLVDLLGLGEAASYALIYGPPIAAALLGLVVAVLPRALSIGRWVGVATICLGAATVFVFQYWLTNECYEDYESCSSIYPAFELGWFLSVGAVSWLLVAGAVSLIRRRRPGPDACRRT
jgi:hypothetical protein